MESASMTYTTPSVLPALHSISSKRPKLSLNTRSIPPAFANRSTSLRLDTLSATSPTARNTFRNATPNVPGTPISNSPALKPASSSLRIETTQDSTPSPAESLASSSVSTADSSANCLPYSLPYNLKSALSNSAMPRERTQTNTFAVFKPMFPAAKRVAFRTPLTEDIKTSKFTMRHSDISSSNSSVSTLELNSSQESHPSNTANVKCQSQSTQAKDTKPPSPRTGDKRDSSDDEDNESCPATPVAGRQKRYRQWVWTLPPVPRPSKDCSTSAQLEKDSNEVATTDES